jgi:muscleblind
MPYKRPAPDNKGYPVYQPSAAAYQQLMQLQSQQPYVPVSCEYLSSQSHALADTVYPPKTSTATPNANNLHHHLNLNSQTSINACNINQSSSNNNNNDYNNFNTSTFFADADAQINTPTAQQNSISQSSPSKVAPSNNLEHNALSKLAVVTNAAAAATSPDDGDSENALTVQNAKIVGGASGCDEALSAASSSSPLSAVADCSLAGNDENNKAINDANGSDVSPLLGAQVAADDAGTQTSSSAHSAIDEHNLNANSFNSATSSSPAAALAAIYTTSSITNNNNSILSRKNSLTTPNQHLINSSKAPTSYTNTPSHGKDAMSEYLSASSLNNHPQAALLSAMLYQQQQPYQQLALSQNHLYSDPAQMAKEMAQKNYANALKYAAAAQQSQASVAGKSQMTAMPYSGVTLSAGSGAMYAQQPGTSTSRMPTQMSQSARSPYLQTMQRPMQNPFQQFIRPQMPQMQMNMQAAANPYYAAAAAHQQFLSQQNLMYSGLTSPMTSQQLTATSGASTPTPYGSSSYPFALSQAQAINAQGMPASMMQVPQMTSSQPSQTGSAAVLNPYKKMKTS